MNQGPHMRRTSRIDVQVRHPSPAPAANTVAEALRTPSPHVEPGYSVESVCAYLVESDVEALPVVDDGGRPVGVVTRAALLASLLDRVDGEERDPRPPRMRDRMEEDAAPGLHTEHVARSTIGEVMSPPKRVLPESAPISRGVAALAEDGGEPVLVVSDDGGVAGLLTSADVVRWLSRRWG